MFSEFDTLDEYKEEIRKDLAEKKEAEAKYEKEAKVIEKIVEKASMEVPAPFAGTVKEIKVNVGDKVSTGSLIMVFEVAGEAGAAAPAAKQEAAPAAAPCIQRLA